jgi:hypothetical protein
MLDFKTCFVTHQLPIFCVNEQGMRVAVRDGAPQQRQQRGASYVESSHYHQLAGLPFPLPLGQSKMLDSEVVRANASKVGTTIRWNSVGRLRIATVDYLCSLLCVFRLHCRIASLFRLCDVFVGTS